MTDPGFGHRAVLYSSDLGFVGDMVAFAREGIDRDEPVVVLLERKNAAALREALGDGARAVEFEQPEAWYQSPSSALRSYTRYLGSRAGEGHVRAIAEIVWRDRSPAECREWMRYEAMVNVAFDGVPASIACLYDTRDLPDGVLEDVLRTHPEIAGDRAAEPNDAYLDAAAFCALVDGRPLEEPPRIQSTLELTNDLDELRRHTEARAIAAGVSRSRIPDLVLAVNEIATNAVKHGGGDARLRTWLEPARFVCEILDTGAGIRDTGVGYLRPDGDGTHGLGLWMTRQLVELVEVRGDRSGTTVRVHVNRET